jgi:hypothetical protein
VLRVALALLRFLVSAWFGLAVLLVFGTELIEVFYGRGSGFPGDQ